MRSRRVGAGGLLPGQFIRARLNGAVYPKGILLPQKAQLQNGQKWQTDAPLRQGMAEIRAAFDADHPAIHAGNQTDAQYAALATQIDQQVKSIVANCRLPADADANLHLIVADLLQGVSLMRGEDTTRSRHDGAALIHGALQAYGQYFDDPAWKPDAPMQVK